MSATTIVQPAGERFRYGGRAFMILAGIVFVAGLLYAYDDMTSGKIEWHLGPTRLPFVIPTPLMIGLWWAGLVLFGAVVVIGLLPAAKLILTDDDITVQSPITRSFRTMAYGDIRHIDQERHAFSLSDRQGNKVRIVQTFLSKRDYQRVIATVRSRAVNAV